MDKRLKELKHVIERNVVAAQRERGALQKAAEKDRKSRIHKELNSLRRSITTTSPKRRERSSKARGGRKRGRALQKVRPGMIIKGVLQGKVPLADGSYVREANMTDMYMVYACAASLMEHREVMSVKSFATLLRAALYLGLISCVSSNGESFAHSKFAITDMGRNAQRDWEDITSAHKARGKALSVETQGMTSSRFSFFGLRPPPTPEEVANLTHTGVVWLCLRAALERGLEPIGILKDYPAGAGYPDLLLEPPSRSKYYAIEVKSKNERRIGIVQGIGQCAGYKCSMDDVKPCLVIHEKFAGWVRSICEKLPLDWLNVVSYNGNGQFRVEYGSDCFLQYDLDADCTTIPCLSPLLQHSRT